MTAEASRTRNLIISALLFLVGLVLACDGFLALIGDRATNISEGMLGLIMMALSVVFYRVSRPTDDG